MLPISQTPPSDALARRTGRVIAMVHELHKAGYQLLRISPGLSPSGAHWRCPITFADNIEPDGWTIKRFEADAGMVAAYSSADPGYFGWDDAVGLSARGLAEMFLGRFAAICSLSRGRDWQYAGWMTEVLGVVEQGNISDYPVFYADYPLDLGAQRITCPPAPARLSLGLFTEDLVKSAVSASKA